jgi:glucan phosphoethanolaminetransferase (alkaline phosphatase superfamily)
MADTRRWARAPAPAGIVYSISWVVGLSIFSASTDVTSSRADVMSAYRHHAGVAMAQFVFTEGVPAVTLALVVWACARVARAPRVTRWLLGCGLCAAVVSLVQCVLGLYLAGRLVPDGRAATASSAFDALNRLDGVKMALLAVMAAAAFVLVRRNEVSLPRWLALESAALAVAIAISGVGYLLLWNGPALAAWVSLPLLMLWVTAVGIVTASARSRRTPPARPSC